MKTFLLTHIKSMLSIAFFCGLISIVMKILDEKLSEGTKVRFGERVNALVPKLSALTIDRCYRWMREYGSKAYMGLLLIVWAVGLVAIVRNFYLEIVSNHAGLFERLFAMIFSIVCWGFVFYLAFAVTVWAHTSIFKKSNAREAIRYAASKALVAWVWLTGLNELLLAVQMLVSNDRSVWLTIAVIIPFSIGMLIGLFLAIPLLPMLVLSVLRMPILVLYRALKWLSTYPKGAWAGLVFVVTIASGVIRLFL